MLMISQPSRLVMFWRIGKWWNFGRESLKEIADVSFFGIGNFRIVLRSFFFGIHGVSVVGCIATRAQCYRLTRCRLRAKECEDFQALKNFPKRDSSYFGVLDLGR